MKRLIKSAFPYLLCSFGLLTFGVGFNIRAVFSASAVASTSEVECYSAAYYESKILHALNDADFNRVTSLDELLAGLRGLGVSIEGNGIAALNNVNSAKQIAEQVVAFGSKIREVSATDSGLPERVRVRFVELGDARLRTIVYEIVAMDLLRQFLSKKTPAAEIKKWPVFVDFLYELLRESPRFGVGSASKVVVKLKELRNSYKCTIALSLKSLKESDFPAWAINDLKVLGWDGLARITF
ncbi:MAG: hypothetical protein JW725_03895 [Candidatus Babeliaceae bacterium]|nr:hypothetical protein [Candidatus Babeliaceae bacterium]